MLNLLPLVPALPLLGAAVLILAGEGLGRTAAASIGAGSVGFAALLSLLLAVQFTGGNTETHLQTLWRWAGPESLGANMALHLDALSLVMVLVITGVGFLIHVYSVGYMAKDSDFTRFFACMNLFIAAMLILVLADNLLLLFLGWEGVGLCSYLLIGFWYQDPANTAAATKAFVVTRIGDAAMAVGIFLLFWAFGTLHIATLLERAEMQWAGGAALASIAALLLLGGAVGKSGQLPLQVWLPDAMAGPTPVSALIHAATMVTAGVYLIARMHPIFALAPKVQHLVAVIGAVTLLLAACAAMTQRDIKRALAYSTISQVGYMFLALGAGAWSAAMFHFMTHAFFKALLFMAAGWIIVSLHHKQDMFEMGGLRRKLPTAFWSFVVGGASLMALPLITSGFYSKDMILWEVLVSPQGGPLLWLAGAAGAALTAVYTIRMILLVFFGEPHAAVDHQPGNFMRIPLIVLAFLATFAGFLEIPRTLGGWPAFSHFMDRALPAAHHGEHSVLFEASIQLFTTLFVAAGILWALALYWWRAPAVLRFMDNRAARRVHALWSAGWEFDGLYDKFVVRPYAAASRAMRQDPVEGGYRLTIAAHQQTAGFLSAMQSGRLRWYMMGIAFGAVITIAVVVFA